MPKRKSKHVDTFMDFIMNHDPRLYSNQWNNPWAHPLFEERERVAPIEVDFEFHIDGHECWAEIPSLEVVTLIPKKYRSKESIVNILVNVCKSDFHDMFRKSDRQPIAFMLKRKKKYVLDWDAFQDMMVHPLLFDDNSLCLEDEEEQEDSADEASEQGSGPGTCEEARRCVSSSEGSSPS